MTFTLVTYWVTRTEFWCYVNWISSFNFFIKHKFKSILVSFFAGNVNLRTSPWLTSSERDTLHNQQSVIERRVVFWYSRWPLWRASGGFWQHCLRSPQTFPFSTGAHLCTGREPCHAVLHKTSSNHDDPGELKYKPLIITPKTSINDGNVLKLWKFWI